MHLKAFVRNRFGDDREIVFSDSHGIGAQARVALDLASKWGLVAATPDGEDSAGRQRLRILTAAETAEKACDAAAELFKEFEARGWLLEAPELPTDAK